jgi:hypothetical protein
MPKEFVTSWMGPDFAGRACSLTYCRAVRVLALSAAADHFLDHGPVEFAPVCVVDREGAAGCRQGAHVAM